MELEDFDENELFIDNFDEEKDEAERTEEEADAKKGNGMIDERKKKMLESVWEETEKEIKKKDNACKPRPKLTEQELLSESGLPSLKAIFDDYRLPEEMDPYEKLGFVLGKMEFWAHNLFPSMTFSDCLDKIERLGSKRSVKNAIRRLRMGMPLDDKDENDGNEDKMEENDAKIGYESDAANHSAADGAISLDKNAPADNDAADEDELDSFFERMRQFRQSGAEQSVEDGFEPTKGFNKKSKGNLIVGSSTTADLTNEEQSDDSSDFGAQKSSTKRRRTIVIDDDDF